MVVPLFIDLSNIDKLGEPHITNYFALMFSYLSSLATIKMQKLQKWGPNHSTVGGIFALQLANLGSISGIQYDPIRLSGIIPEQRTKSKPKCHSVYFMSPPHGKIT